MFAKAMLQKKRPGEAGPEPSHAADAKLLCELRDLVRQARDFPARAVLVNDVLLRRAHQIGLRGLQRLQRGFAVALGDGLLDRAHGVAHAGAARFIDGRATGDLAGRLAG